MSAVYILTRGGRYKNLEKVIPRWVGQEIPVFLIVEKSEMPNHLDFTNSFQWKNQVAVRPLPEKNAGIGAARAYAVRHADKLGHRSIIMSDDDIAPEPDSDMRLILEEAEKPGVLGIGSARRIHNLFTKGALFLNAGLILCPGGWGMQLFGLNVKQALALGNFDPVLDCFGEDHELMRLGIAAGIPWLIHCDVRSGPIGARYQEGGINSYVEETSIGGKTRAEREIECRKIIHRRWPEFTSPPDKISRVKWKLMLDHYIPDWKSRSAMHGGQWPE